MNKSHSRVTDWGLSHITVHPNDTILDAGCGGGLTINKLATIAAAGKVYGIDFSSESVAASKRTNAAFIPEGRVEIHEASVTQLPFQDNLFDLITAVETHFWWPDLPGDMHEVFRVVKPGGQLLIVAEVYRGGSSPVARYIEKHPSKFQFKLLTVEEHRALLVNAGFSEVQIFTEPQKAWISALAKKR